MKKLIAICLIAVPVWAQDTTQFVGDPDNTNWVGRHNEVEEDDTPSQDEQRETARLIREDAREEERMEEAHQELMEILEQ
jgi:hypothetical protein